MSRNRVARSASRKEPHQIGTQHWESSFLSAHRLLVAAKLGAGQLLARARWRRCFAFSLALRLFARIVLLALTVFFT